jgi:hypothetical protein
MNLAGQTAVEQGRREQLLLKPTIRTVRGREGVMGINPAFPHSLIDVQLGAGVANCKVQNYLVP